MNTVVYERVFMNATVYEHLWTEALNGVHEQATSVYEHVYEHVYGHVYEHWFL